MATPIWKCHCAQWEPASIPAQVKELRENQPVCRVYIAQTKADLLGEPDSRPGGSSSGRVRSVPAAAVQAYADSVGAAVFVTSAKTGVGVQVR